MSAAGFIASPPLQRSMSPLDGAWLVLKDMQPAFQDDPSGTPEDMRHYGQMQQQMERFTPRGNTLNLPNLPSGAQPPPYFGGFPSLGGTDIYQEQPELQVADLRHQADFSRNPGDARRYREQADQMEAAMQPAPAPEAQPELSDMDEVMRILEESQRRARVPYSYRRKIKPLSDQEVSRDLRRIRNFRR